MLSALVRKESGVERTRNAIGQLSLEVPSQHARQHDHRPAVLEMHRLDRF
jgi:hypothetical protein